MTISTKELKALRNKAKKQGSPAELVTELEELGISHIIRKANGKVDLAGSLDVSQYIARNGMPEFGEWNGSKIETLRGALETDILISPFTNKEFTPDVLEELRELEHPLGNVDIVNILWAAKTAGVLKYDDADDFIWDVEAGNERGRHKPAVRRIFKAWSEGDPVSQAAAIKASSTPVAPVIAATAPEPVRPTKTYSGNEYSQFNELMLDLFRSTDDLRMFANKVSSNLSGNIAWGGSLSNVSYNFHTAVRSRGWLRTPEFWDKLVEERPLWSAQIRAVQQVVQYS